MPKDKEKAEKKIKRDFLSELLDFVKDMAIIILVVMFIRSFLVMPFQISGQSMYSSYYNYQFIIVDRFSYLDIPLVKTGKVERGDVVVFRPHVSKDKEYFIKRIIGLPGESVKISGGRVYIFDKDVGDYVELHERYLNEENALKTYVKQGEAIYTVPEGHYFVMGDNRNHSTDSRNCFSYTCSASGRDNFIQKSDIVGHVWLDLGYFNWLNGIRFNPFRVEFGTFRFEHPNLVVDGQALDTHPTWTHSPSTYDYAL